jgi:hypothetical protein
MNNFRQAAAFIDQVLQFTRLGCELRRLEWPEVGATTGLLTTLPRCGLTGGHKWRRTLKDVVSAGKARRPRELLVDQQGSAKAGRWRRQGARPSRRDDHGRHVGLSAALLVL